MEGSGRWALRGGVFDTLFGAFFCGEREDEEEELPEDDGEGERLLLTGERLRRCRGAGGGRLGGLRRRGEPRLLGLDLRRGE